MQNDDDSRRNRGIPFTSELKTMLSVLAGCFSSLELSYRLNVDKTTIINWLRGQARILSKNAANIEALYIEAMQNTAVEAKTPDIGESASVERETVNPEPKTEPDQQQIKDITIINFKGKVVLTLQQAAIYYQVSDDNIRKNFNRNKEHFIEGEHFFKIEGEELKQFKNLYNDDVTNSHVVDRINSLILFTEKGMLLLAKSCQSSKAWEVYGELVEFYFNRNSQPQLGHDVPRSFAEALRLAADKTEQTERAQIETKKAQEERDKANIECKQAEKQRDVFHSLYDADQHFRTVEDMLEANEADILEAGALNPTNLGKRLTPQQTSHGVNKALDNLALQNDRPENKQHWHKNHNNKEFVYVKVRNGNSEFVIESVSYRKKRTRVITICLYWIPDPILIKKLNDYFYDLRMAKKSGRRGKS